MAEKPFEPKKGEERYEFVYRQSKSFGTEIQTLVDKETGVNYLFVSSGASGGLTPLLDADGKPIVTPID